MKRIILSCSILTAVLFSSCSSTNHIIESPKSESIYKSSSRNIGDFNVDSVTKAPLRVQRQAIINLPPDKLFKKTFIDLPEWFSIVDSMSYDHSKSENGVGKPGAGSTRKCLSGNKHLAEKIHAYKHNKYYAFSVNKETSTYKLPIKNHLGAFLIEDKGNGKSLMTWRAYLDANPAILSPVLPIKLGGLVDKGLDKLIALYGGERLSN